MGLVRGNGSCQSTADPAWARESIPVGMQHGQTAAEWTRTEAILIAGVCPDRLDTLYANIAAAGYPAPADGVRQEIEQAAKSAGVPLDSNASPSSRRR